MIAVYAESERQRSLVSGALGDHEQLHPTADWPGFERVLENASVAVLWLDSLREERNLSRLSTLAPRCGAIPTVLITRKEADGVRHLVGLPRLEIVWPDEVPDRLLPATRRARTYGLFQRITEALERADNIPSRLRRALIAVCRWTAWPSSLARIASDAGCDRRTLWRQWRKVAGSSAPLRLEDVLDRVLLLRALSLKRERGGWTEVSDELRVHETTLARLAKRLTGRPLGALECRDIARLGEELLHDLVGPVSSLPPEGHSAFGRDVLLLPGAAGHDTVLAGQRVLPTGRASARPQTCGYTTSQASRGEGSVMADEGLGYGQPPGGRTALEDSEDIFAGSGAARGPAGGSGTAGFAPSRGGVAVADRTTQAGARPAESDYAVGEVAGEPAFAPTPAEAVPAGDLHTEVGSDGGEGAEEFAEATPAQMAAAEAAGESAASDLQGIEGYEPPRPMGEAALNGQALREAGEGTEGEQEEFLPILASLVPALVSTVGPAVAKGVGRLLSPRAKRVISRVPRPPMPLASTAAKVAVSAVTSGTGRSQLLSLIAKLLESAEAAPAGESGMEVDQTFVQQAAAALEVIVDYDDRVRITQTTMIPWRRICALRIEFPTGATYRGTGFLIGPRAVATAGHCVYLHNQGGWARKVTVIPACNGTTKPFGQAESASLRSVSGWVNGRKPESDYGCVILPTGSFGGHNLGSFGFAAFDSQALLAQAAVLAGYPGDKPFAELWGASRFIKTVTAKTLIYNTASMGGQSGAPVYIKRNGQRYVVGIHNYGATTGNSATRVTQPVYQRLRAWSQI